MVFYGCKSEIRMRHSNTGNRAKRKGYSGTRPDVNRLIERPPGLVLDVGCGGGANLFVLAEKYPESRVVGVDKLFPSDLSIPSHLEERVKFVKADVEAPGVIAELSMFGAFDLLIFADILEHLLDPWDTLKRYCELLAEGGAVISSLPNVRHYSTFSRLLMSDRWPRHSRGIHDRTHRHFFARRDILDLGEAAGLRLKKEKRNVRLIERTIFSQPPARLLDFWPFRPFVTFQYVHLWEKK